MDFSAICRTCIKTYNIGLNPIFLSEGSHEGFSTAFFSCTGVQVKFNDGLPQNMCTACMNQFNNTLKFREQCKQAETQLLKIKNDLETDTIVTNEQLFIEIREHPHVKKTQLAIDKSDFQDCSNLKRVKSECNIVHIKNEPLDNDVEEHKILLHQSNDFKICIDGEIAAEDSSDTEFFNEQTILFKNENSFKTESIFSQNTSKTNFKCSQKNCNTEQENTQISDNEDINESSILEKLDLNTTTERNIDIPYVISETDTKKTTRVVCKLCQKELSIRSIDSHMMRRHPGADKRKVKCELCDKYLMREKLNRHRVMMHGSVGVRCGYCKSEFKSQEVLVDHVATCTAKFKKRKVNDSGRALAECDICKMTMQRASLIKHKAVKHAGLRPVCEHCGKSFGNKFRLNEHYRAKHGYEKFQCSYSYCDFRSASIMAMRNHERRHRGEKPFICETCGAKFHAAYILMQHKHSHRTEKLVKCDLCPASFKANNNLHMHKLTCHSKSFYSCTLCARTYKCRHYALKHARLAHLGSEPSAVIKLTSQ